VPDSSGGGAKRPQVLLTFVWVSLFLTVAVVRLSSFVSCEIRRDIIFISLDDLPLPDASLTRPQAVSSSW